LLILVQRQADSEAVPPSCTTIFIKNLAYDITEEEIGHFFKPCGIISSIRLVYNSVYKHFKGYVLINIDSVMFNSKKTNQWKKL
jgi:RNA recognition motif-containing protein